MRPGVDAVNRHAARTRSLHRGGEVRRAHDRVRRPRLADELQQRLLAGERVLPPQTRDVLQRGGHTRVQVAFHGVREDDVGLVCADGAPQAAHEARREG